MEETHYISNNLDYFHHLVQNPLVGNKDQNTVQRNTISPPITGRYIQLNPIEWNQENEPDKHDICMRIALYKCKGKRLKLFSMDFNVFGRETFETPHNNVRTNLVDYFLKYT